MKKILCCVLLCFLFAFNPKEGIELDWEYLKEHVGFTEKYNKKVDMLLLYPTFSEEIKALNGKQAYIKGYIIESDPSSGIYVLSRYPMAQCYFCGGAGPDSIVEIQLKDKSKRYETDDIATISGTFYVNATDIEHCNYILKKAVVTLEKE